MQHDFELIASIRVRDVMTRGVVEVMAHQTMDSAALLFSKHDLTGAPVVDNDGCCVGVLSANDFQRMYRNAGSSGHVTEYMTAPVKFLRPEETLIKAAVAMCAHHIHRLPVLDEEDRPVGMISPLDALAAIVNVMAVGTSQGGILHVNRHEVEDDLAELGSLDSRG